MKAFKVIFGLAAAMAMLALSACSDEEKPEIENENDQYDDAYYAALASVSSNDGAFISTEDGGTIYFKTEGGSVTVDVDCGTAWTAVCDEPELFDIAAGSSSFTVTASQNTVEEDLSGTVTVATAAGGIVFATISIVQSAYGAPEISVDINEWHAPAVGVLTTDIVVEASADYTYECTADWLTIEKTGTGVTLTAEENEQTAERAADVVLTVSDGIGSATEIVEVTQDGAAYIALGTGTAAFGVDAGSYEVTVESNFDWDFSYDTANGWFTVIVNDNGGMTVSVVANDTGSSREGLVTLTAGDGLENVTEATLKVTQGIYDIDQMIFTLTTTKASQAVHLPLSGTVDCTVDWGDGTSETVTSSAPTHTYASAGSYTAKVSGTVTALDSSTYLSSTQTDTYITGFLQWGNTGLTSLNHAFFDCTGLATVPSSAGNVVYHVEDCAYAFYKCNSLTKFPEDLFANFPDVTTFERAFQSCSALTGLPENLFSNCTKVENFSNAFNACNKVLTSVPEGLFANCPEVTAFDNVFNGCTYLENIPAGLFANNPKVTTFASAFTGCTSLKIDIPEGLFANNPAVTDFTSVFGNDTGITSIPASLFENCPEVTTFSQAFMRLTSVTEIPAGLFANNQKVTDFSSVFSYCTGLTSIPEGLFSGHSLVETFASAFASASNIESIPADLFKGCTNVTAFGSVFNGLSKVESIPEGLFADCPNVTGFNAVFSGWQALKEIPENLFANQPEVTTFQQTFYNCKALTSIPEDLFENNTKVTTFMQTFQACSGLEAIPEKIFSYAPGVTTFQNTFYQCTQLTSIPENLFAANKDVTSFSSTFNGCSRLTGESAYDLVNGEKVHLYDRTEAGGYTVPTTTTKCYSGCTQLDDYTSMPSAWID